MPNNTDQVERPSVNLRVYDQTVNCGGVDEELEKEMNRVRRALMTLHPGLAVNHH